MKREATNAFGKVFLTMEYEADNNLLYNNWLGYQTVDSIMKGANTALELMAQTRCPYLLNDNTNITGPWGHAVAWIAEDWTPRAIAVGLTHFAHVVSPESFAALSAETMAASVGDSFRMRIFGSVPAARQWLREAQQAAG